MSNLYLESINSLVLQKWDKFKILNSSFKFESPCFKIVPSCVLKFKILSLSPPKSGPLLCIPKCCTFKKVSCNLPWHISKLIPNIKLGLIWRNINLESEVQRWAVISKTSKWQIKQKVKDQTIKIYKIGVGVRQIGVDRSREKI